MDAAIEIIAKTIFEGWGGPWMSAPEFRKTQARRDAVLILEAVRQSEGAKTQVISFLNSTDMGDLSAA